ncbi:MAG: rhomboid family intramembrane serine protease [Actinobacteria bacterium]|nr:rhomboid family intramembrane serine protease [Actinomycetota bacterium]
MVNAPVGFQCPSCAAISSPRASRANPTTNGGWLASIPPVTRWILVACVGVYFFTRFTGGADDWNFSYGMWPNGVASGQWYRVVTATFLHAGILHLLFNMYALYILGPNLERLLGSKQFFALYFLSALGGSTLGLWFSDPNSNSIGASGAIFGLLTATIVIGRHLRADVSQLIVLLAINAVIGFSGGIDWRAHLGGALTGALIAANYVKDQEGSSRVLQRVGTSGVAIGLLVLIFLRCQQLMG